MLTALSLETNEKQLLELVSDSKVPSYRQAYSDRTAWLMASLSELVYQPFGDLDAEGTKEYLTEKLDTFLDEGTKPLLEELMMKVYELDSIDTNNLLSELEEYGLSIEHAYSNNDTQALLFSAKSFIVLVFRGTEATSLTDIKADLKAYKTKCVTEGNVHFGFKEAYEQVSAKIQNDLNKSGFAKKPLFIAGHSLGGALATVAAKRLVHKGGIAACYTFGSPRVGDEEWSYGIKTPIYRVVNAVDCVTMLPPSGITITLLSYALKLVPIVGKLVQKLFGDYLHVGDMRYLTNCKRGKYEDVELTYRVHWFRRMQIVLNGKTVRKFVADHSISIYRKKLAIIALRRNKSG